jgi:dinuclear metal center YbgI/SA1388 family protein
MERPTIREVITFLETIAPKNYQESYDNSGLLTGQPDWDVTGVLTTLDCTEKVVQEAIERKCNLIVSHHPIIFKGLKKITGQNYVERTIIKAIKNDIALYAIHTNLDNVYWGVNKKISEKIGLINCNVLVPKVNSLSKLVTFVPTEYSASVLAAIHEAGAGAIGNYRNCSFTTEGTGTFLPTAYAKPSVGEIGSQETVAEHRIEVILPSHKERQVIDALKKSHPYEEVVYYLSALINENQEAGAGMIGELKQPEEPKQFLSRLKNVMRTNVIRHTQMPNRLIKKVALCGGSGSFLLPNAMSLGADAFVSADFKYHEFFDADNRILIADIGHFESEQFTKELLQEVLTRKFPTFAINFSNTPTNPISYL